MYVCAYLYIVATYASMSSATYLHMYYFHVCKYRVTNITINAINEVDQSLISNVIEVRMYICTCV